MPDTWEIIAHIRKFEPVLCLAAQRFMNGRTKILGAFCLIAVGSVLFPRTTIPATAESPPPQVSDEVGDAVDRPNHSEHAKGKQLKRKPKIVQKKNGNERRRKRT